MELAESKIESECSEGNISSPNIEEFANFAKFVNTLENKNINFALVSKTFFDFDLKCVSQ